MTPEERLNQIEMLLRQLAEAENRQQAQFFAQQEQWRSQQEGQWRKQQEQWRSQQEEWRKQQEEQWRPRQEQLDRISRENDKNIDAIRSLIAVGRTCLDSIRETRQSHENDYKELRDSIRQLREAQAETGEKLNILIDTVDRIIRRRNGHEMT